MKIWLPFLILGLTCNVLYADEPKATTPLLIPEGIHVSDWVLQDIGYEAQELPSNSDVDVTPATSRVRSFTVERLDSENASFAERTIVQVTLQLGASAIAMADMEVPVCLYVFYHDDKATIRRFRRGAVFPVVKGQPTECSMESHLDQKNPSQLLILFVELPHEGSKDHKLLMLHAIGQAWGDKKDGS